MKIIKISKKFILPVLFISAVFLFGNLKSQFYPLESAEKLQLINLQAKAVMFKGHKAVRITEQAKAEENLETLAIVSGSSFKNGTIEIELSGQPLPSAVRGARGFVGLAFRVQKSDPMIYDCFYLRPANGRAEDQLRRNHSCQYISHPEFTWFKLREENPGMYESYVDLVPGEWTKVKIVVDAEEARLYVHDADQPCLIINKLLQGEVSGAIGLWIGIGTEAHFRNLRITEN